MSNRRASGNSAQRDGSSTRDRVLMLTRKSGSFQEPGLATWPRPLRLSRLCMIDGHAELMSAELRHMLLSSAHHGSHPPGLLVWPGPRRSVSQPL